MRSAKSLIAHLLLASALAAPTTNGDSGSGTKSSCKPYIDNFDDLGFATLPQTSSVTQYGGLTYEGFDLSSASILFGYTNGIFPKSYNNDITATFTGTVLKLEAVSLNPFGNIVAPTGKYFDLTSFYFGCGLVQGNPQAPGLPVGCSISVTGYYRDGSHVPVASFDFTPMPETNPDYPSSALSKGSKMSPAVLPQTFKGLQNVTFGIATGTPISALALLDLDDIKHCNYE